MKKEYEVEKCECGHVSPVEFNSHDDDGNAICPDCTIVFLCDLVKDLKKSAIEELTKMSKS
jgi:hypothetical protein